MDLLSICVCVCICGICCVDDAHMCLSLSLHTMLYIHVYRIYCETICHLQFSHRFEYVIVEERKTVRRVMYSQSMHLPLTSPTTDNIIYNTWLKESFVYQPRIDSAKHTSRKYFSTSALIFIFYAP